MPLLIYWCPTNKLAAIGQNGNSVPISCKKLGMVRSAETIVIEALCNTLIEKSSGCLAK